jgi:hypothetical protein
MWFDATACSNNDFCSIVAQQCVLTMGTRFNLLRNNDPGHAACLSLNKNATDKEI